MLSNLLGNILKLPDEYLPLDSFEAEGGFFYNRKTEEVLEIEIGRKTNQFPEWKVITTMERL